MGCHLCIAQVEPRVTYCNDPKNELVKQEPHVYVFEFGVRFHVVVCCPELWLRGSGVKRGMTPQAQP